MSEAENEAGQRQDQSRPWQTMATIKIALTRAILAWERLWSGLWPASGVAGAFLALALADLLPALPGWLHLLVLAGFGLGFGWSLARGLRGLRWPDEPAALGRLEAVNRLDHRPLRSLGDRLAAGADDPLLAALWRHHRRRLARRVRHLRLGWPHPGLPARDPLGMRAVVLLTVVAAAAGSWGEWRPRLSAALLPRLQADTGAGPASLDLWLTPPEYTGAAPSFLHRGTEPPPGEQPETVRIPAGSVVMARVSGGSAALPTLEINQSDTPFQRVDDGHFQLRHTLTGGDRLGVRQGGRVLGRWPVSVVPDQPPEVAFSAPPAAGERGTLRLDFEARDDYGLVGVTALIRPAAEAGLPAELSRSPLELPLPIPGLRPRQVRSGAGQDLTASPWAGLPVRIALVALDAAGQKGVSPEQAVTLPERPFHHPVARLVIEARRQLIRRGDAARPSAAETLRGLSGHPAQFHDDVVTYLSLRTAALRLVFDQSAEALAAVRQLLWEVAVRIEDGRLSLAARDLREAERALADALEHKADDAELRRLMDELEQAFVRYLDGLEQQQQREALGRPRGAGRPAPGELSTIDREELEEMFDQLRAMTESGSRDAAQRLLSRMRQLLDSVQDATLPPLDPARQEQLEALRQLEELTGRQRDLLDRTYRQTQTAPPEQDPGPGLLPAPFGGPAPGIAPGRRSTTGRNVPGGAPVPPGDQGELRRQLGELLGRLGNSLPELPQSLGQAERAMRDAERALRQGQPSAAVPSQTQAVDNLRQGIRALGEQLLQGSGMSAASGAGSGGRDPLGRLLPGQGTPDTTSVQLPDQRDLQRAREILDELRRRAGQRERPRLELDYIDRLLRQY